MELYRMGPPNTKHKILLTGGAGFIGSHVAQAYLEAGHPVVIVDNLSTGKKENIPPQAEFYQADIGDLAAMEEIFKKERPVVVNHHAAQIDVRFSVARPVADAKTNILDGIQLLELSKKRGVQKWIFASTGGALYGETPAVGAAEETAIRPVSPYGVSKFCLENYLEFYGRSYSLQYAILRYANVYGPRQIPEAEAGVVAIFTGCLMKGKIPTIYGDGRQQRDFVYVEDVAQANLKALNLAANSTVNIGSGKGTTVLELLLLLQKELKSDLSPKFASPRLGEIFRSVVDNSHAQKALGWRPQTSLAEGLKKTIAWQKAMDKR